MIKQRFSLALSLLWRTYLAFFIYSGLFSLVLGFTIGGALLVNADFLRLGPPITLALFALLITALEVGCRMNVLQAVFGARLKRSPAQWRTYVLQLSLLMTALAILNALLAFFAPFEVWVYYKVYGSPLLLALSIFVLGWAQAPSTAEQIAALEEDSLTRSAPKWP